MSERELLCAILSLGAHRKRCIALQDAPQNEEPKDTNSETLDLSFDL